MSAIKIIIYENGRPADDTVNSLKDTGFETVVTRDHKTVEKESVSGDHKITVVTDSRNIFRGKEWLADIVHAIKPHEGTIACPVFCREYGGKEEYQPSVLTVASKNRQVALSASWKNTRANISSIHEVPSLMGCCQIFTRKQFETTGCFEDIAEPDNRDVFISLRTWLSGGRCVTVPSAKVKRIFDQASPVQKDFSMEKIRMALLMLPQKQLQYFMRSYILSGDTDEISSSREIMACMEKRLRNGEPSETAFAGFAVKFGIKQDYEP